MANSILSMKNDVILEILESEYAEIYGIDLRSGMIAPLFVENSLA